MNIVVESTATRLSAVDDAGHEICGAHLARDFWHLHVDAAYLQAFGLEVLASPMPMFTRAQALSWVHVLVQGYLAKAERPAA